MVVVVVVLVVAVSIELLQSFPANFNSLLKQTLYVG